MRFVLFEQNDTAALSAYPRFQDWTRQSYDIVLQEAEKLAVNVLAPLNAVGDRQGVVFDNGNVHLPTGFKDAYAKYAEGGWIALTADPEWGGMGLPGIVGTALMEMFTGANTSFIFTPGLTFAASHVIQKLGGEHLRNIYVQKMNSGQWAGTMCLTEPQAGSAVGDARTTATPVGDGTYKIVGNKIFISSGMHDLTENIIHLVLARTPNAPPGTAGLSLFVVPYVRVNSDGTLGVENDVRCTGVEEKMGIHASSTCSLSFGDNNNCLGYIIGNEGEGMRHMFQMMNEARLIVGVQGSSAANAAFQLAKSYAHERIQGTAAKFAKSPDAPRVPIIEHANVRQMLMEIRVWGEGCRAMMYRAAFYADLAENAPDPTVREKYHRFLELLTPICKAYGSEAGLRAADVAIQVHGGYGYIREYGVEQIMRDVKIASIYEGTNSIQALDLLARKVARGNGRDFQAFMGEISGFITQNLAHTKFGKEIELLQKAQGNLIAATIHLGQKSFGGDVDYTVMVCKPYLTLFGHVVMGWLLLEQAIVANQKLESLLAENPSHTVDSHPDVAFYTNKGYLARFFVYSIMPATRGILSMIQSDDRSAIDAIL